jgi:hypothetical protein
MWCPAPLSEGELNRRKLRSDKYKPPAGRMLEFYESDSSVEANEDTDAEAGGDAGTGPSVGGAEKRRTRSAVGKQLASAAAVVSAVQVAEKKKKRKRRAASPPVVVTSSFRHLARGRSSRKKRRRMRPSKSCRLPRTSRQGGSESLAAKRQRELVQKTSEDALRRGLEAQRTCCSGVGKGAYGD